MADKKRKKTIDIQEPETGKEAVNKEEIIEETESQETEPQEGEVVLEVAKPVESPLETAQREASEYLDSLQRLKAEFDNFRKRVDRDRARLSELHQSIVIETLLPTLDAFDAAFGSTETEKEDPAEFKKGIVLVHQGLKDALTKLGLERISVLHKPFDFENAEAVMTMPSEEHPPETVLTEISAGYRFKDKVLRPARVIVCADPPKPPVEDE